MVNPLISDIMGNERSKFPASSADKNGNSNEEARRARRRRSRHEVVNPDDVYLAVASMQSRNGSSIIDIKKHLLTQNDDLKNIPDATLNRSLKLAMAKSIRNGIISNRSRGLYQANEKNRREPQRRKSRGDCGCGRSFSKSSIISRSKSRTKRGESTRGRRKLYKKKGLVRRDRRPSRKSERKQGRRNARKRVGTYGRKTSRAPSRQRDRRSGRKSGRVSKRSTGRNLGRKPGRKTGRKPGRKADKKTSGTRKKNESSGGSWLWEKIMGTGSSVQKRKYERRNQKKERRSRKK